MFDTRRGAGFSAVFLRTDRTVGGELQTSVADDSEGMKPLQNLLEITSLPEILLTKLMFTRPLPFNTSGASILRTRP